MNEEEKTNKEEIAETERERKYKEDCISEFALRGQIRNITGALVSHLFNSETLNRSDVSARSIMLNGAFSDARAVSKLLRKLGFAFEEGRFVEKEELSEKERTNVLMSVLTVVQLTCLQGYWKKLAEKEPPQKATRRRGKFEDGYETARKRMMKENEHKAEEAERKTVSQEPTERSVKSRDERGMIRTEYLETLSTEKLKRRLENVERMTSGTDEPSIRWADERDKIRAVLVERGDR